MSQVFKFLNLLSQKNFISGTEKCEKQNSDFSALFPAFQYKRDLTGNFLFYKKSGNKNPKKILVEAHIDTIGFCVKDITENGFISLSLCGGFDQKILPGTEVNFVNSKEIKGVICNIPPHLEKKDNQEKKEKSEIFADFGFSSKAEAETQISIGDPICFSAPIHLLNDTKVCGPGLDNRGGVAALMQAMTKAESENDLYFLFSFGEETTSRGIISAIDEFHPDIAIVVDAGFGSAPGLEDFSCIEMDMGPSVSITDTLSRPLSDFVISCAKKNALPLQIVCEPGGTGTSATKLQLQKGGIPCVVISFPLRNMHTPSEIASIYDLEKTAELICALLKETELPCQEVKILG